MVWSRIFNYKMEEIMEKKDMMWVVLCVAAIAGILITKSPKSLSILWVGFWVEFLT